MYGVQVTIKWCMGHRLVEGYVGPCSKLHGHNYRAVFTFESKKLNNQGFVIDFKEIKKTIKEWVDYKLDHILLLNQKDPLVKILEKHTPVVVLNTNPTAENIAKILFDMFKHERRWPKLLSVDVWETDDCCATYDEYGEE